MEQDFKNQFETDRIIAIEVANQEGWLIRKELPDGSVIEIQKLATNGMPVYNLTNNLDAAKTISTDKVWPGGLSGLNLSGNTLTLGEWDSGAVLTTHQELDGRVNQVDGATTLSWHSTHVAGTMIATGIFAQAKGMAYQANLDAYDWNNDGSEMSGAAAAGLLLSNHSYGYVRGWWWSGSTWYWYGNVSISETEDYLFGFYTTSTRDWDQIAYNAPYYLIVMSAGNDRNDYGPGPGGRHRAWIDGRWKISRTTRDPDGGSYGYDCIGSRGVAKNLLTVGAVNDIPSGYSQPSDVSITSFSSWGPTDDGRIKPDIVANGDNLTSAYSSSNTAYASASGTSMSSPSVTGSLLLLQEHYKNNHAGNPMRAATLKALIIHTADEAGPADGPDYMFGWGLMNTASAADIISNEGTSTSVLEETLSNFATYTFDVTASGVEPLIANICWTDPAGTLGMALLNDRTPKLVNDLDLRISDASDTYYPWVLDPDNPSNAATQNDNVVDNIEKVFIASPVAGGTYTISVSHKGLLEGLVQDFSMIVSGLQPPEILSIADAATQGWINLYCYTYDGTQYIPISPYESTEIQPWTGFWVVVNQDLDLMIPKSSGNPYPPPTLHFNVDPIRFYLISSPLDPSSNRDINVNFGDDLGDGLYEQKWRVAKWDYDTEVYENYNGPGTLADIIPGRGFFLQHIHPDQEILDITGNYIDPIDYYELKLPSNGDLYTYHMAGNPYWYGIQWKNCKVRVPMTDGLPLAKPAVLTQEDIESWYLGLKLESFDGKSRDTYNRAGVIMTPGVDPQQLCALDLTPPGNYVRLALKDPFDEVRKPLTYDYRPSGLYEYSWEVELTTTYDKIDVKFTLDNFEFVPDDFSIILKDTESGDVLAISDDISFDLELTSGSTKTYVLTATSMLNAETIVEEEEDQKPVSFGITGIRPNPFNPATTVSYTLDRPGNVTLKIYNLNGQLGDTIVDGYIDAGYHSVVWNAKGHASGVYIVSLVSQGKRDFRKITLVK